MLVNRAALRHRATSTAGIARLNSEEARPVAGLQLERPKFPCIAPAIEAPTHKQLRAAVQAG